MEGADREQARRLPAGVHGIPSEVVARNQRERLIAAVAEACAEKGYADVSVADLAHRAGVSTATFYKLFAGKHECALEAHRELLERLLEEVDAVCAEAVAAEALRLVVRTVLELLAADPPSARLLTVEVLALGPAGAERKDEAVEAFATRLRTGRDPVAQAPVADWIAVAGAAALIGKLVMAGNAAELPELEEALVLALTQGAEERAV